MKDVKYGTQVIELAFAILLVAGLVSVQLVSAQGSGGNSGSGGGSGDQVQDRDRIQDPTTHDGDEPIQDRDQLQNRDRIQDPIISSTTQQVRDQLQEQERSQVKDRVRIDFENVIVPAGNAQQLRVAIQNREQELGKEATNTPEQYREILQNQNRTRLAIHAINASEDLLGAVGPQTMQITQQINNSVQTSLNAEAEIRERGIWKHVFFGGDRANALILGQEQEENRLRIEEIKRLINDANINSEIRATLMEQVRIMEEEQKRLSQLAEKESGQWGIFSWRF